MRSSSFGTLASRSQRATEESAPPDKRLQGYVRLPEKLTKETTVDLLSAFKWVDSNRVHSGWMSHGDFVRAILPVYLTDTITAVVRKLRPVGELYRVHKAITLGSCEALMAD